MKLSIFVPAYNEQDTIEASIRGVLSMRLPEGVETEIIVVDDASTDRTAEIAAGLGPGVLVIRQRENLGKGCAIRAALEKASGDIVVIHDADLEYDAADIPLLAAPVISGVAPAAYGTRFSGGVKPSGMKMQNFMANKILSAAANMLFGAHITDEATCYKAVRTDLLRSMRLKCRRFEFCPEVTAKLLRDHHSIVEVPVRYHARTLAEGKKIHWYDGFEAIFTLLKYRFVR